MKQVKEAHSEFDEIRPYEAEEMQQAFEELISDRQFNVMMRGMTPWLPKLLRNGALRLAFKGVKTPLDFQKRFMKPIVNYIIRKHTDGCTFDDDLLRVAATGATPSSPTTATSCSTRLSWTCCSSMRATRRR